MPGSIEKRGKNSWRLVVSCGLDGEGNQIKKTKSVTVNTDCPEKSCKGCAKITRCRARKEAEQALAEFVLEIEKGTFVAPSKLTFKDFVERWLRDYAETNLAPKTLFRYRQLLDSRIFPAMGHLKIEQIRPVHLLEFYKNLQEDGIRLDGKPGKLSERTILHHHRLLSTIFNDAVEWQVIPSNPAARVKPPKVKKKQVPCYDEQQTAALLEALEKAPLKYRAMVALDLATGVRRGELMGLEWKDVDFEKGTITVRRAAQYLPGKGTFEKDPKNETSKRTIAVPGSVMALLKEYRKVWLENRLKVGDLWQGSDRLFTTWDGKPMHPDTITKWFPQFLAKNGLPHINFHALRHTSISLLILEGVHPKAISARAGHSNISTTMDIYGHLLKSADREAAEKLEGLFNGKAKAN